MTSGLEFSSYSTATSEELCLRSGAEHENQILLIPPLFDEMNRMRRMLIDTMRLLNERGVGTTLPDLPGQNESLFPQEQATLATWKEAVRHCATKHRCDRFIASVRGGCLTDHGLKTSAHWRLAPVKGNNLLRTMMRTRIAADKEAGISSSIAAITDAARKAPVMLAGNQLGSQLFTDLEHSVPEDVVNLRTVRLNNDSKPSDVQIEGSPLWLRAEPDADPMLSAAIADDLASWVRQ